MVTPLADKIGKSVMQHHGSNGCCEHGIGHSFSYCNRLHYGIVSIICQYPNVLMQKNRRNCYLQHCHGIYFVLQYKK